MKIGQYAKNVFKYLLDNNLLNKNMLDNLEDKNYCSKTFGLSYSAIVKSNVRIKHYYANLFVRDYVICCEWKEEHRPRLDYWLRANGLYSLQLDIALNMVPQTAISNTNTNVIVDNELEFTLRNKINEINGIRDLCWKLTGYDSNPEYVDIVFEKRKKITTSWYDNVYDFIEKNQHECISSDVKSLKLNVISALNADDIYSYDETIKPVLIKILGIIAGLNVDTPIYIKANKYIEELIKNNVKLIIVLLGEYIDNKKTCEEYDRNSLSTIILYLHNIKDFSIQDNVNYDNLLYTVFAHEYFHFHHYFNIKEENKPNHKKYLSKLNTYIPAKVIKEGLASYFEYEYAMIKGYFAIAKRTENSWYNNDMNYYPYAAAKHIIDKSHFKEIFIVSLHDIKQAYKIL